MGIEPHNQRVGACHGQIRQSRQCTSTTGEDNNGWVFSSQPKSMGVLQLRQPWFRLGQLSLPGKVCCWFGMANNGRTKSHALAKCPAENLGASHPAIIVVPNPTDKGEDGTTAI